MNKTFVSFLFVFVVVFLNAQDYQLKDLIDGTLTARGVQPMESAVDGIHYYQMNPERSAVIKFEYATGKAVDTLFNTKTARECRFDTFQGFLVSNDENRVIVYRDREQIYRRSFKADYYYYDVRRNLVRKLSQNSSKQMAPVFSPDGKMLAYVCDNNIWLSKFDFDTESQVTKDGELNKIINGATDWVYEEEFGTTRLMEFSPDNKLLAFVRTDESAVEEFQFQTYNQKLYPDFYKFKYPKAGEKNSEVTLNVFDIESRTIRKMDLPLPTDGYIPKITFTANEQELVAMTLNRNQNRFDMYFINPRSTVAKLVLREESKYYIDSELLNSIHFLSDRFTYISERDGYSHIYIYGYTGTLQKQLTTGAFDVTNLLAVDTKTNTVYYEAADESPMQRTVYKTSIDKPKPVKLSDKAGVNSASFSNNGKFYVNRYSNLTTAPLLTLHDANGKQLRVLEDNKHLTEILSSGRFPQKEFISVPAADGITQLNGWILKPKNFNSSKKYPVVMIQYSGPNSQQVMDSYGIGWEYALLNEDILVACVDGRGTGARGEAFRKSTYLKLGVLESDDQAAAARYLGSLPYVDGQRIGIWGWSYGGYNVLMSMSRGQGAFKAGVAIAPVTDWKFYDTVYTERFMLTPQQNAAGYKTGSAIELANQLQGKLLMIHGTSDDNVHFQNAIEYSRALIDAGKHFEMFYFPDKDHFISGGNARSYLYEKTIGFFKTNL